MKINWTLVVLCKRNPENCSKYTIHKMHKIEKLNLIKKSYRPLGDCLKNILRTAQFMVSDILVKKNGTGWNGTLFLLLQSQRLLIKTNAKFINFRCWWIIGFAISFYCCGGSIYNIYSKWNHGSVIVSFAEELTPVRHIPFPAITLCPTTKLNITQLNLTDTYQRVMEQQPLKFSNEQ